MAFVFACLLSVSAWADTQVTLDFYDVDIKDMAKSMSQIVGKNFMLDDTITGKVTIISPKPVSVDEAYEAFLAALAMKGYTIVEKGVVSQIRKRSDAIRETDEVLEGTETVDSDRMITRIIPIQYISANDIQKALKGLFSRSKARMVAYGPTNSLIVTDLSSNIRRLIKIVQKLDQPGFQTTVEVIPLKYAKAQDVSQKLLEIFSSSSGSSGAPAAQPGANAFSSNIDQQANVNKIIPDERSNSLIVTANRMGIERVLDLISQLDTETAADMSRTRIHVRHLKHADAEKVAELLSGILAGNNKKQNAATSASAPKDGTSRSIKAGGANVSSGLLNDEIRIGSDPSTNSLVITATPQDFSSLEPVINELDRRRPQVFVEALIMEVKMTNGREFGTSFHGGTEAGDGGGVISSRPQGSTLNSGEGGAFANLLGPGGLGLGFLTGNIDLGNGTTIPGVGAILEAVQTNENFNVLSSPNILTTDNTEAEIIVGQTVSNPTTSFDPTGTAINGIKREDANLELRVTPQINEGDEITMEVEQIIDEPIFNAASDFTELSKRRAKTTIVAQNGQTIVIGGLIKDRESSDVRKVPILGDVPILGSLFKKTSKSNEKINLMVFLTPTILRDAKDISRISVKKNNQRRNFNKANGVDENEGLYKYGFNESLNMAPSQTQEVNYDKPVEVTPQKRFDYMTDTQDSSDVIETNSNSMIRDRYSQESDPGVIANPEREDAEDADATQADNGNPFATVRPN